MDPMIWILGAIGVTALAKSRKKPNAGGESSFGAEGGAPHGILTPGRQDMFERAMRQVAAPEKYEELAGHFDTMGLPVQARYLRLRAQGRRADSQTVEARRKVVRQALRSDDPAKIEEIAKIAEERLGMTIAAEKLREVATGLRHKATLAIAQGAQGTQPGCETGDLPDTHEPTVPGYPYVAEDDTVTVTGAGGTLASHTQLAGETDYVPVERRPCHLDAGGECLVHSTSGGCAVGSTDKVTPPDDPEIAKLEAAAGGDDPFARR